MTADVAKKSHHHHHHHCRHNHTRHTHTHKKMVSLKSVERFTNLPVVESAHAYYEKIKSSNTLIKWGLVPAETGMWLAVETALPVVNYFEKPVSTIDSIFCQGLDVIEANLPIVKYPPDLVYSMTKDYVNSKVVSPMLMRADSVKQLSLIGVNNFSEIATDRLNHAINVAEKYVDKYLPDMARAADSTTEKESKYSQHFPNETTLLKPNSKLNTQLAGDENWKKIKRLHVYSDGHGKHLADKLRKIFPVEVDIFVSVSSGASSSYIVQNAIRGSESFTKSDVVVLIAGLDDVTIGKDCNKACDEFLENIRTFVETTTSTSILICPILPQHDLPKTGSVNQTIVKINNQLQINLADSAHTSVLNVFSLRRKYFNKSGLHLTGKGKTLLASIIRSAVVRIILQINGPSIVVETQKNKPAETLEHVNRFSRKLQRRLTERTLAEAKALRQQGVDTARTVVYLLDLLARNPKLFMEKAKEVWGELSKEEPENQMPPGNIEQLIGMLVRETARRIVHLSNYTRAKALMLSEYSKQAAHIGAINAVWWADQLIKTMHLESAVEASAKQITRIHHVSIELLERLLEIIRNLKTAMVAKSEASVVAPGQVLALPPPPPTQSTPQPESPPDTDSTSTTSSTASYSSSSSSAATLTNKPASESGNTSSTKGNKQTTVVA